MGSAEAGCGEGDVGAERIDEDVELVWSGALAPVMRPMTYGTLRRAVHSGSVLYFVAAIALLPVVLGLVDIEGVDEGPLLVVAAIGVLGGLMNFVVFGRSSLEELEALGPIMATVSHLVTPVLIGIAVVSAGPNLLTATTFYVSGPIYVLFVLQRGVALGFILLNMASCGIALTLTDGVPAPGEQWLVVVSAAIATAVMIGIAIRRADDATRDERAAKAQLADLNAHLEQRVAEQVDELERVGQLRRFLAPQVADVVVSRGSEALLQPHRREVAVLFCDLRGFTRFTNAVDAGTVVDVLGEYYAAVGAVLEAHGATIGGYDGDGIMAYLGDPIPRDDTPTAAVAMARDIGDRLDAVVAGWRAAGHDLGYGIGLAHGPATLGVVGFDGRFDYTALGAVVNLAARLCADAASGEIVVDESMRIVAGEAGAGHRGDVTLKGFDAPVPTYALVR